MVQSAYDDCSIFLLTLQSIRDSELNVYQPEREYAYDHLDALASSLNSNLRLVMQTLDSLLSVGHNQAEMAQGDYNGSIDWRMSQLSVRPIDIAGMYEGNDEDVVDMALAFGGKQAKSPESSFQPRHRKFPNGSNTTFHSSQASHDYGGPMTTGDDILIPEESVDQQDTLVPEPEGSPYLDDDRKLVINIYPLAPSDYR